MRVVVYGAGAIGGLLGGRLAQHGHDVVLIARIESPDGSDIVDVPVVDSPARITFSDDDVVVLAMKSQDTLAALDALAAVAPSAVPVVCAQNGVANERMALRRFPRVHALHVMCPATHLVPGVIEAQSSPVSGILDLGRYPDGTDATSEAVAAALTASSFSSEARGDIMAWKHRKLLSNLANSIDAACERTERSREIGARARAEGEACFQAAGIAYVTEQEDADRRGDLLSMRPVGGRKRGGGSSWQSLERGTGSIEADYLNGEIVLLGRLHGVPTPVNAALQQLANRVARDRLPPRSLGDDDLDAAIAAAPG
jgi:2-dehydropantoate 2-reductase